ncbi:DUF309 domain-containing protein [Nitrosophilus labii]|uniref:DUF309 domain-containing protein n=1 Tax=Nitrosophilus labii TaxID=2706014 RepID=UPI0016573F17|nr:DUF309 domain-containing protein [Nitrosophilus labii]
MDKRCELFIKLIEKEKYYDAHEVLEEVWFPNRKDKNPDILLLKAFINASVSFELIKRGKEAQARKVWGNYQKYIVYINKCSSENIGNFKKIKTVLESNYAKLLS